MVSKRLSDGRIVESRVNDDMLGLMTRIGAPLPRKPPKPDGKGEDHGKHPESEAGDQPGRGGGHLPRRRRGWLARRRVALGGRYPADRSGAFGLGDILDHHPGSALSRAVSGWFDTVALGIAFPGRLDFVAAEFHSPEVSEESVLLSIEAMVKAISMT